MVGGNKFSIYMRAIHLTDSIADGFPEYNELFVQNICPFFLLRWEDLSNLGSLASVQSSRWVDSHDLYSVLWLVLSFTFAPAAGPKSLGR